MMKYKVGDKVKVRSDLTLSDRYGGFSVVDEMIKKKIVTITFVNNDYYEIEEDIFSWTDEMFEGLADDELTATEAIRLRSEMCENNLCVECRFGKHNNGEGIACCEFSQKYPERVIEFLKQWKKDHEKKEIETEIVDLIRIMKEDDDSTTCIYAYEIDTNKEDIVEKMDELVKQYYEENGGKIYTKFERICRVKPCSLS